MSLKPSGQRRRRQGVLELGIVLAIVAGLAVALAPSSPTPAELTPEQVRAQQMMDRATAAGAKLARIAPAAAGVMVSAASGDPVGVLQKMAPIEIEKLNEQLAADPQNTQLYLERSRLRTLSGELDAAIADLNWVMKISSPDDSILHRRADLYIRLGRYQQALADNQAAPSHWNALLQRAEIEIGLGQFQKALSTYQESEAGEDDYTVSWGIGAAYRGLGQEEKAQTFFQHARRHNPSYCRHWQTSPDPGEHEGPHYRFGNL